MNRNGKDHSWTEWGQTQSWTEQEGVMNRTGKDKPHEQNWKGSITWTKLEKMNRVGKAQPGTEQQRTSLAIKNKHTSQETETEQITHETEMEKLSHKQNLKGSVLNICRQDCMQASTHTHTHYCYLPAPLIQLLNHGCSSICIQTHINNYVPPTKHSIWDTLQ